MRTLHFLIWPNVGQVPGARATVMEGSPPNNNHHETIYAALFEPDGDPGGRTATVLSPWYKFTKPAPGAGATLHLGTPQGNYVDALGDIHVCANDPAGPDHCTEDDDVGFGPGVRRLQLPDDPPFRHLEIGPDSPDLHEVD